MASADVTAAARQGPCTTFVGVHSANLQTPQDQTILAADELDGGENIDGAQGQATPRQPTQARGLPHNSRKSTVYKMPRRLQRRTPVAGEPEEEPIPKTKPSIPHESSPGEWSGERRRSGKTERRNLDLTPPRGKMAPTGVVVNGKEILPSFR